MRAAPQSSRSGRSLLLLSVFVTGGVLPAAATSDDPSLAARILQRLDSDRTGMRRYRYVESAVQERRDGDGEVRSRAVEVFEVFYQDGRRMKRPLANDLKEDSEGLSLMRSEESRFLQAGGAEARARKIKESPFELEKLVGCFQMDPAGRETLAGRPSLKLSFTAVEGCLEQGSRASRILEGLAGTVWVDEETFAVARVRGHLQRPVSFGLGILGRVRTFEIEVDREPLAPGLYAMTRVEYRARGTSFLFYDFDVESTRQRSAFTLSPDPPAPAPPPEPQPGADLTSPKATLSESLTPR
jgi:hypothetical protein